MWIFFLNHLFDLLCLLKQLLMRFCPVYFHILRASCRRSCKASSFPCAVSQKTLTCCASLPSSTSTPPTLPWSSLSISCSSARQWRATSKAYMRGLIACISEKKRRKKNRKEKKIIHTQFSLSIWTTHHLSVHLSQRFHFLRYFLSDGMCTLPWDSRVESIAKCKDYRYSMTPENRQLTLFT